ncbi:hypothetical protein Chor_011448 [Crotalus horridus]
MHLNGKVLDLGLSIPVEKITCTSQGKEFHGCEVTVILSLSFPSAHQIAELRKAGCLSLAIFIFKLCSPALLVGIAWEKLLKNALVPLYQSSEIVELNWDVHLGIFQILPKRCTLFVKKESLYMFTVGVLRIWVFSEGHRTGESTLEPLQREAVHLAVKAQVPIIPVVMSSYRPFFNMKTNKFTSGDITIRILPPVKTKGLSPSDIPDLTDHVWGTILSTFHEISEEPEKQASVIKEDTRQAPNY